MPRSDQPAAEPDITVALVEQLIAGQFPHWASLPIEPVEAGGWDNRSFRLGEKMSVRLPSSARYSVQIEKEHHWLPRLAPLLPLSIPTPLAMGGPAEGYPWHWSVYEWIEGEDASTGHIEDVGDFATALARFLVALQGVDASSGPPPGRHNFFRGGSLRIYDAETRAALDALQGVINAEKVMEVWDAALAATWRGPPVWLHGDVSAGNLLVRGGRLCAVIDFGCCGVGDPACDLAIAWTFLGGEGREAFRRALPADVDMWARGRGWALWKSLITLADSGATMPPTATKSRNAITDILADHARVR